MPSLTVILAAIAILAPLGTYGVMRVQADNEVRTERRACDGRIQIVVDQINSNADANVAAGRAAASGVTPIPRDRSAMIARCKASNFCESSP